MKKLSVCLCVFFSLAATLSAKIINLPVNDIQTGTQKIISEFAPLYSLPSDSSTSIFTPLAGEKVVVLAKTDDNFSKVLYDKKTVYVKNSDISDNYEKATFFNQEGAFATKFYKSIVSLPLYIPAKNVKQALKVMQPAEIAFFDAHTNIDKNAKGKPYKILEYAFDSFEEYFTMNTLCSTYFPDVDSKEQLVKNGNYLYVEASYGTAFAGEKFDYDEISDITIHTKDFDGNSILSFKYSNINSDGPVEKKLKLLTLDLNPKTLELQVSTVLDQVYYSVEAMDYKDYNIVFPGDLRGIHNQIRIYSKPGTSTNDDFYFTYKNNRFEKQSNFGILNEEVTSVRNFPSAKNSKIIEVIKGNQQVTIYGISGSGKVQNNTLDLWYKIAQFEEKYVNATAVNLFPFFLNCYDYELKDSGEKQITDAYTAEYDELFFTYSSGQNFIRAENLNWMGYKPTIVKLFTKELSEIVIQKYNLMEKRIPATETNSLTLDSEENGYSYIYGDLNINGGYPSPKNLTLTADKKSKLPLGLTWDISEKTIKSILGTPVETITIDNNTQLVYYTNITDSYVHILTITFKNNKLNAINLTAKDF